MRDFDYEMATTLEEALVLMSMHEPDIRPMAGGTDLIDHVRNGHLSPERLIDVKRIRELNVLELDDEGLHLGAAVPCYKIHGHAEIVSRYSALADSCHIIGGIQIQSRASAGGNICNSGPAADATPSVIALDGVCVIAAPQFDREVASADFCTGPGQNVLEPDELLVEIRFPPQPPHSGSHYRRFIPRNEMDIAVVGVGASVQLDESGQTFLAARIALGAVGPTPLLASEAAELLVGQPVNDETLSLAAEAARRVASPITDMRGTAEYRTHLVGVLTQRVLRHAVARARGEAIEYQPGH